MSRENFLIYKKGELKGRAIGRNFITSPQKMGDGGNIRGLTEWEGAGDITGSILFRLDFNLL